MWRGIRRTNNSLRILATTLAHTLWQKKNLSCVRLSNVSLSQQSSCSSCLDAQGLTLSLNSYKTDVNPQSLFVTVLVVSVQDISRSIVLPSGMGARLVSLRVCCHWLLHIEVRIWRLHFAVVTYSPTLATVLISTLFGPFWPCSSHQGSRCGSASSASSLSSSNP